VAKRKVRKKTKRKKRVTRSPIKSFLPRRWMIVLLLAMALAGGIFYAARSLVINSDFFSVKEVVINRDSGRSFRGGERRIERACTGKNIFVVDLDEIRALTADIFPELRKVEVKRVLPDRIEVNLISRSPVAVVEAGGEIIIDSEGAVLGAGEDQRGLVRIKGIGFFVNVPPRGKKIKSKVLERALLLLKGIQRKLEEQKKEIKYIDISDRNNILLGIRGVTVKMGKDNFSEKIDNLKEILTDPDVDLNDINYIDLRFKPAVMALK